jgi:rubredoxin
MPWLISLQCNGCFSVIHGELGHDRADVEDQAKREKWQQLEVTSGKRWFCPTCAAILAIDDVRNAFAPIGEDR